MKPFWNLISSLIFAWLCMGIACWLLYSFAGDKGALTPCIATGLFVSYTLLVMHEKSNHRIFLEERPKVRVGSLFVSVWLLSGAFHWIAGLFMKEEKLVTSWIAASFTASVIICYLDLRRNR